MDDRGSYVEANRDPHLDERRAALRYIFSEEDDRSARIVRAEKRFLATMKGTMDLLRRWPKKRNGPPVWTQPVVEEMTRQQRRRALRQEAAH